VLEDNKAFMRSGKDGYTPSREGNLAARVPEWLVVHWMNTGQANWFNPNDWTKILSMLDSDEYAWLRTSKLRLSRVPHRAYCRASTASSKLITSLAEA
jgi:hypothetical protein